MNAVKTLLRLCFQLPPQGVEVFRDILALLQRVTTIAPLHIHNHLKFGFWETKRNETGKVFFGWNNVTITIRLQNSPTTA